MEIITYNNNLAYVKAEFDNKALISYSTEDKGIFLVDKKDLKRKGR